MPPRRRAKGFGTVYQDKSGQWWAKLSPDDEGRRPKKRVESRGAGERWLREKQAERERGIQVRARMPTLEEVLKSYLDDIQSSVKKTTHEAYVGSFTRYIRPRLGDVRLNDLTPQRIRRWLSELVAEQAAHTARNAFRVLRSALRTAVNDRIIAHNPTDGIKAPSGHQKQAQVLSLEEVQRFLRTAAGDRLYPLYYLLTTTGMREGEILGLRWSSVVTEGKTSITVKEQVQIIAGKPQFTSPKSAGSKREIPIDAEICNLLRQHRATIEEERQAAGEKWNDHDLVFPTRVGTPMRPQNLLRQFRAALRRAELPERVRIHDLRHTAGSLMLAAGATLTDVSKILGHSSVTVTARIYAHSYTENQRRAVSNLTEALKREGERGYGPE